MFGRRSGTGIGWDPERRRLRRSSHRCSMPRVTLPADTASVRSCPQLRDQSRRRRRGSDCGRAWCCVGEEMPTLACRTPRRTVSVPDRPLASYRRPDVGLCTQKRFDFACRSTVRRHDRHGLVGPRQARGPRPSRVPPSGPLCLILPTLPDHRPDESSPGASRRSAAGTEPVRDAHALVVKMRCGLIDRRPGFVQRRMGGILLSPASQGRAWQCLTL